MVILVRNFQLTLQISSNLFERWVIIGIKNTYLPNLDILISKLSWGRLWQTGLTFKSTILYVPVNIVTQNSLAFHQYLTKERRTDCMAKFPQDIYLFSQFSSLETFLSAETASADAWIFMMWLAISCKRKILTLATKLRPFMTIEGHSNEVSFRY